MDIFDALVKDIYRFESVFFNCPLMQINLNVINLQRTFPNQHSNK